MSLDRLFDNMEENTDEWLERLIAEDQETSSSKAPTKTQDTKQDAKNEQIKNWLKKHRQDYISSLRKGFKNILLELNHLAQEANDSSI